MAHVFISYSKQDIDFARHLRDRLAARRFSVWLDESRLAPSARWWTEIEDNIERCAALIVIMSPTARESDWVEREILYAERLNKPIFPVLLAGEDWPRLANLQYADMRAGLQAPLPRMLEHRLTAAIATAPQTDPAIQQPVQVTPPPKPRTARVRRPLGCFRKLRRVALLLIILIAALVLLAAFDSEIDTWLFGNGDDNGAQEQPPELDAAAPPDAGWFEEPFDSRMPREGWDYSDNWMVSDGIAELGESGFMFRPSEFDNMVLSVRLRWETDEGQMGIVFRAAEPLAYILFFAPDTIGLEQAGPEGGDRLIEHPWRLSPDWHEVTILAIGEEVEVLIDDEVVFHEFINHQRGGVGLFMDGYGWLQVDHFAILPP